jgi:hypothetical protein
LDNYILVGSQENSKKNLGEKGRTVARSFQECYGNHPCAYWHQNRGLAVYLWEQSGKIPYCGFWRVCKHCHDSKYAPQAYPVMQEVLESNLTIFEITFHLRRDREHKVEQAKLLKNFNMLLRREFLGYVCAKEDTNGLYHVHYAVFGDCVLQIGKLWDYLLPRHNRLFMDKAEDDNRLKIWKADDVGWIGYCYGLGKEPREHVPSKGVAHRPVVKMMKNLDT